MLHEHELVQSVEFDLDALVEQDTLPPISQHLHYLQASVKVQIQNSPENASEDSNLSHTMRLQQASQDSLTTKKKKNLYIWTVASQHTTVSSTACVI